MFIYAGKLSWAQVGGPSAEHELAVLVLPNGHVRIGDQIYLYSQWTVDSKGNKKQKWFEQHTVDKVTRAMDGNDIFYFGQGYYRFKAQISQGHRFITLTISDSAGKLGTHINWPLERAYFTVGDASADPARIWTGSLNWPQYANNEPFMVIVPEGFGAGKPILAFWQWTLAEDQSPLNRVRCIRTGSQQAETTAKGAAKFCLISDYTVACTWDEKTEKLGVHMEGPEKNKQDIELALAALIEFPTPEITTTDMATIVETKLRCWRPTGGDWPPPLRTWSHP